MPRLIKPFSPDWFLEAPEPLRAAGPELLSSALVLLPREANAAGCLRAPGARGRRQWTAPPSSNLRKRDPLVPKSQGSELKPRAAPSRNSHIVSTESNEDSFYLSNHTALARRRTTRRSAAIRREGANPSSEHW